MTANTGEGAGATRSIYKSLYIFCTAENESCGVRECVLE